MSCNFTTHATSPLALTTYKYIDLKMPSVIQKLSCKANCKTPFFHCRNPNLGLTTKARACKGVGQK